MLHLNDLNETTPVTKDELKDVRGGADLFSPKTTNLKDASDGGTLRFTSTWHTDHVWSYWAN